ncbi:acyltransferase [Saccharibacillus sp. CPCC 101409]|uniref:acyltransferase n=1 Tax=Saccharibacillus sp. CPCC 101409 TaxID=3058041 RepID=UPI002673EF00|nr:acyltransferase [Saccharibacillus sp. CPCC 101409]MDO3413126.1 acyltransferase [Saccharibacillus sp. CPCC 101409]
MSSVSIKKERLPQLDTFRALAILGVLHVHSTSFATVESVNLKAFYLINFLNAFFRYGTPSFIMLSSFVLFYNYFSRPVNGKLVGGFYKKRMLYILLPYVLISAVYFIYKMHVAGTLGTQEFSEMLPRYWKNLREGTAYTHLYFVYISVQFYILFPLMLILFKSSKWIARWAIPIGLLLQWGFVFWNKYDLQYATKGSLAITYLSYYMMGAFLAIHFDKVRSWMMNDFKDLSAKAKFWNTVLWISWFAVVVVDVWFYQEVRLHGLVANSLYYELIWNVHTLLTALVLMRVSFLLYRRAPKWIVKGLTRLGELSFAVYLVHPLVLGYYRDTKDWFFSHVHLGSVSYFLWVYGGLLSALIVSWIVTQSILRWIPGAWVLLGNVPASLRKKKTGPAAPATATERNV